jgi:transcriptional regulator with XRE-family HTH domain
MQVAPSAKALALRLGIDQSKMSRYELGKERPSKSHQPILEDAFGWPRGRILILAGAVTESTSLREHLEARPLLTEADRDLIQALVDHLERMRMS